MRMLRQTNWQADEIGIGAFSLDPGHLPTAYWAPDNGADDGLRRIELHSDHVVICRTASRARMKLRVPIAGFHGVGVRVSEEADGSDRVEVLLVHADADLNVTLFAAADSNDVVAEWQSWGKAFALPLLVIEHDGTVREAFPRLGQVLIGLPGPRRRRRSALRSRRPSALMRRKAGGAVAGCPIHREREIIARS
jgi:Family of unknown function (DUF6101)